MKRIVLVVTTTMVVCSGFTAAVAAAPTAATACTPGVIKVGGTPARRFCGPAKATVHIGSSTVKYAGGECSKSSFGFAVNIGTVVLGTAKKMPEYFGVTANPTAGTHRDGGFAVVHLHKRLAAIKATVVLKAGLKSGTFSGKVFGSPTQITGTFTC